LTQLHSLSLLAEVQDLQGRLGAAVVSEQNLLEAMARVLGLAHRDTIHTMETLAMKLQRLGRKRSAMELMSRCAPLSVDALEPTDPDSVERDNYVKEWQEEEAREKYISSAQSSQSGSMASEVEKGADLSDEVGLTIELLPEARDAKVKVWLISDAPDMICEGPVLL